MNRKARFDYAIEDTIEAGIALIGAEVKSIRYGLVSLVDSFVANSKKGMVIKNMAVQKLPTANRAVNFDERRDKPLLLRAMQMKRLRGKLIEKGATIVPLKLYFNNRGLVKVLLGVGLGKSKVDKRKTIEKREWERDKARLSRGK